MSYEADTLTSAPLIVNLFLIKQCYNSLSFASCSACTGNFMTIRNRTLIIVATTLAALVFILLAMSQFILLDSYSRLEAQRVDQNLTRVSNAVDALFFNLRTINRDWAHWDRSYAFALGQDDLFVEEEMPDEILSNVGADFAVILDAEDAVLVEKAVDRLAVVGLDFPPDARAVLTNDYFTSFANMTDTNEAVVIVEGQPLLVAATSILTSRQQGPVVGALIFGQRLDEARIAEMAESLDLDLALLLPDLSNAPQEVASRIADLQALSSENPRLIQPLNGDLVEGILRVPDLDGQTAFYMRLLMPRDIVQQGQNTIALFTAVLLISGGVLWGAMLGLLEISVLRPLSSLNADVGQVNAERSDQRVLVRGEDEIGHLAQAINRMLERLDDSRRAIRESEERLRTVVDNAPILIWMANKSETITNLQGSSVKALGLNPAQIIGQDAAAVAAQLGLDMAALRQALQGQEASLAAQLGESQFITHYQPIRDSYGAISAVIGVATDVSKSRQSAEEVQDAYRSLEKKNQQLERVQALIESTLAQMEDALQRTAPRDELRQYVRFARERLDDLG